MGEVQRLKAHQATELGRDRTGQFVFAETQPPELNQIPQPPRHRARQLVPVEIQRLEVRQAPQLSREPARQSVPAEIQRSELNQVSQPPRHRARQLVPVEIQRLEVRQAPQLGREPARQSVPAETQPSELNQVSQPRRDRARQFILGEVQDLEVRQAPQLRREPARQLVLAEPQPPEMNQFPHRPRHRARQVVAMETQFRDPAGGIGRHAVPLAQRRLRLPVRAVGPGRAARRVVERLERRAVRRGAPLAGNLGGQTAREADGSQQEQRRSAAAVASGRRPPRPTLLPTDTPTERGTDRPVVHYCGRPNCGRPNVSELRVRCACLSSVISCCFHQISYTRTPGTEDAPFRPRDNVIRAVPAKGGRGRTLDSVR